MNSILNSITESIFFGTAIFVPCLFAISLFKIKIPLVNELILIRTVNVALLMAAMTLTVLFFMDAFTAYYSGGEYEIYTFTNRFVGPYWPYGLAPIFRLLLPQILWFKKLRNTIISSAIIVSIWGLLYVFTIIQPPQEWVIIYVHNFLQQAVIYMVIITALYFLLSRRSAKAAA